MFDVQIRGDGDTDLVMLYGCPVPAESLEPLSDEFAGHWRVLIPETVSCGITPEEALPRLEETLAKHDVDNPVVLGHSLGAYRAFQLALSDEIDVDRLVTIGPFAQLPDERLEQYAAMTEQLDAGELDLTEVALEFWFRPEYIEANPGVADQIDQWFDDMGDAALKAALLHEMQTPDLRPKLSSLDTPTCILVGDSDVGTPPEWSEEISGLLPDSRLHLIRDCGHFPHFEQPDITLRILRGFLSD